MQETQERITAKRVSDDARLDFLPAMLPGRYLLFEHTTFANLENITVDYGGGFWDFFTLSNGGFYIAPQGEGTYDVRVSTNGFHGTLSHDAAGIVASLFALNALCWRYEDEHHAALFYKLREFACDHEEAADILGAID